MAEEVQIGNGKTAKMRSPWFVGIVGILTLGIYLIFWWYFVNREMADYGRSTGDGGARRRAPACPCSRRRSAGS